MINNMQSWDFTNPEYYGYTSILSGEIGSGKTSFIIKMLVQMLKSKDKLPFKNIFINVDGISSEKMNAMAVFYGKDVKFHWLDMTDFMNFASEERASYTKHNSLKTGKVAAGVREDLSDKYLYFDSFIVCDEADHYMTGTNRNFANFLKFRRHYSIGIFLLTQKFQNLNMDYYNSGAINAFLRIRQPIFNVGNKKFIQRWTNSNILIDDNLMEQRTFTIESEYYDYYDSGQNIGTKGSFLKKKLIYIGFSLFVGIIVSGLIIYNLISDYGFGFSNSDKKVEQVNTVKKAKDSEKTKKSDNAVEELNISNNLITFNCVTFQSVNCYVDDFHEAFTISHIAALIKQKTIQLVPIFEHKNRSIFTIDKSKIKFLFSDYKIKEEKKGIL